MCSLIEGLPDAVALRCLARVPYHLQSKLQLVSRLWRAAFRSPELFKARLEVGSSEDFLCVSAQEPENIWQLYDPTHDLWMTLPVLPSGIRHLAHFGAVSLSGRLFVLGGGSDHVDLQTGDHDGRFATDEVWSFDPVVREWAPRARMLVPRAMFACCVLGGRIVVAGGFTSCRKSISQAEVYDPEKDAWARIADLHQSHNSACSGVVVGGRMHVLHRGFSTAQVLSDVSQGWGLEESRWVQGAMAVVRGSLYVTSGGILFEEEIAGRRTVQSMSQFRRRIDFGMAGVGDEIYVVGGVIGPDQFNRDIEPISEVDVLAVGGGERIGIWRRVGSMTRCRGTIRGCVHLSV